MAGTKEIKRRIKSVKNTKKITKAMELVAASKMKRAVSSTLASRLYAEYSWEVIQSLGRHVEEIQHPFFIEKKEGKTLFILITSNRGLCGGYNSQVLKKTIATLAGLQNTEIDPVRSRPDEVSATATLGRPASNGVDIVTIGKKGGVGMRRTGQNVVASFEDLPENIHLVDVLPISKFIINEYKKDLYKNVFIAYTHFVSALNQKPNVKQILPIPRNKLKDTIDSIGEDIKENTSNQPKIDYLFEGSQDELVSSIGEKITRMQIYQMLLESNASEQSARMVAMKNASEAAGEMIDDLTLVFNKARQAGITQEISEISAGMASIS